MKKQIIIIIALSYTSLSYANNFIDMKNVSAASGNPKSSENSEIPDFLPKEGDGIRIIADSKMHKNNKEFKAAALLQDEYKQNGFVKRRSDDAVQLLSLNKHHFLTKERKTYLNSTDFYDTHLKQKISQIKLAFEFHPISFIKESEVFGFAVADTWVREPKEGWTGIIEAFAVNDVGSCNYQVSNAKLNRSAANLSEDSVTYAVNNKPTITTVEGNDDTGYSYKVEWFHNDYYKTLTCALKSYDSSELDKVVMLANKIDRD